jgi:hypothetical protein
MAGTHINFQDVKVQRSINVGANQWYEAVSQLSTREHIYIENTGVSHDWTTAHVLRIRFWQDNAAVTGEPQVALLAPGDSFEANFAAEVRIGLESSVVNGSWTLIESENIIRKDSRNYDVD